MNTASGGTGASRTQSDLRQTLSAAILARIDLIAADTIAIFPFTGNDALDTDYCRRLGRLLVQLLASAVRDGRIDARSELVADLYRAVLERRLPAEQLFSLAYLSERTALDELALDESFGATSEAWPLVAQLIHRGSFDLLAAYTERTRLEPGGGAMIDALTTLHTRPMFDAVLAREVERADRYGFAISLILFDVDRLSAINAAHGYRVGDKILERLGILMRTYFRQHDWLARHADDAIAVLLTHADAAHAADLAERVRATVEDRLGFTDHRTGAPVTITLTAVVINMRVQAGGVIDPERLLADVEAAMGRAKTRGRNRVEQVDGHPASRTLPHSSPSA